MATGTDEARAQAAVVTCTLHGKEKLYFYCKTCMKQICEICFREDHSPHDWCVIDKYIQQVRKDSQQTAKRISEEIIAPLKARKEGRRNKAEIEKVRKMQVTMKKAIDQYADDLVSMLDDDKNEDDLKKKIEEFETLVDFFAKHAHTAYDSVVMEMGEALQKKLQEHKSADTNESKMKKFKAGNFTIDNLKLMFGKLEEQDKQKPSQSPVKASITKSLTHGEKNARSIETTDGEREWINISQSPKIVLVDLNGKDIEAREANTKPYDFTMNENDIIYTAQRSIFILSPDKLTEICSTSPLTPTGICMSADSDGMLVCLVKCHPEKISPSTQGEIKHIDMAGLVRQVYLENQNDLSKLFTWPHRVAQNVNSDLCVIDWLDQDKTSRVVGVTEDGRVRFTCTGQSSMEEQFTVWDVVCDSTGRIILTDVFNYVIHMLSSDGEFLQYLLTEKDGLRNPMSLALHDDTMWVGCGDGVIKVCKLDADENKLSLSRIFRKEKSRQTTKL